MRAGAAGSRPQQHWRQRVWRREWAARRRAALSGTAGGLPGRGEYLIRGATILSMDAKVGDFVRGDVLVRDGAIVGVARDIAAPSATVIDAGGMICMPGFVDTHWHLWTSVLRPVIRIDNPKSGYQPVTNRLGRFYTPEDSYRSVKLGLAEGLSAGATTVHNWAHNIRSPAHADAELRAMRDVGLRGRLAYGTPMGYPDEQPMDLEGLAQIKRQWMPNDGMLTLGISSRNVGDTTNPLRGNISVDTARKDWGGARALGLHDHHAHFGAEPDHAAGIDRTARSGPAAGASIADHGGGTPDAQQTRRQLQHLAHRGIASRGQRRRDPVGGVAAGRGQGQYLDRPYRQLRLRLFPVHAHSVCAAPAPHRTEGTPDFKAAGAAGDPRRCRRSGHRRPHRFTDARQTRRHHPWCAPAISICRR